MEAFLAVDEGILPRVTLRPGDRRLSLTAVNRAAVH